MNRKAVSEIMLVLLMTSLLLTVNVHALTPTDWTIEDFGGFYSFEPDGSVHLWSDAGGPNQWGALTLYQGVSQAEDFYVSVECKAIHRGAFGLFLRGSLPIAGSMHGVNLEFRETGEFLLSRYANGWLSPSFATGTDNIWYTLKLSVFKSPFHVLAEVFENNALIGSLSVDDMTNISFESLQYVGFGIWSPPGVGMADFYGNNFHSSRKPECMFQDLLDFYDENIESENLQGTGPNDHPAENREKTIRNMINTASNLYADGLIEEACEQLHDIYMKIDGESPPTSSPDFIVGDLTVLEELRQRILELLEAISCHHDP